MTHIFPIDREGVLRTSSKQQTHNDPFDVVVFLNHFLTNDGLEDALSADPESYDTVAETKTPAQQMVMQSRQLRLCVTLGSDTV